MEHVSPGEFSSAIATATIQAVDRMGGWLKARATPDRNFAAIVDDIGMAFFHGDGGWQRAYLLDDGSFELSTAVFADDFTGMQDSEVHLIMQAVEHWLQNPVTLPIMRVDSFLYVAKNGDGTGSMWPARDACTQGTRVALVDASLASGASDVEFRAQVLEHDARAFLEENGAPFERFVYVKEMAAGDRAGAAMPA